jgi:hypothetical protein
MAIDWSGARAALRAWFLPATGLADAKVIWANQNGPRPLPPFATINPRVAIRRLGVYDEERLDPDAPGQIDRVGQRKLTISCNAYGPGAIDLLERAQEALDTNAARAAFASAGLAVSDRGEVRDLTKLLETQYEERAQLDVVFALATASSEDAGYIESAEITATLLNPDGTTAATFTQTTTSS